MLGISVRKEENMSEIKGQILGVILVLMVFAAVAGTMTALFSSLSKTITNQVSEIDKETSSVKYFDDKLIHFND